MSKSLRPATDMRSTDLESRIAAFSICMNMNTEAKQNNSTA